jgi:hypothetical protein
MVFAQRKAGWRGGAIGASDMALVNDTRLLGNTEPLAAVADDSRPGIDTGA